MSSVRINLLPHRELKRAARKREFIFVAAGTLIFSLAIAFLAHSIMAGMVEAQLNKNKFLKAEIAKVDKEVEEIQRLKDQTAALLARKQVVETLQSNRTEAVHLLDQLVRQLPDGIYLKSVRQNADKINLTGYAQSNARIATLMRSLDSSPWLGKAELVETKAVQLNNLRINEFSLNIQLKREQAPDAGKPAAKEKGA
jgi:type IV pilus assembly protein PilN